MWLTAPPSAVTTAMLLCADSEVLTIVRSEKVTLLVTVSGFWPYATSAPIAAPGVVLAAVTVPPSKVAPLTDCKKYGAPSVSANTPAPLVPDTRTLRYECFRRPVPSRHGQRWCR